MRTIASQNMPDAMYKNLCVMNKMYLDRVRKSAAKSPDHSAVLKLIDQYKRDTSEDSVFNIREASKSVRERNRAARFVTKNLVRGTWTGELGLQAELKKAGVTTALNYNFLDLRGPAALLYPVNTPFRDQIARTGKENAGVGTMAQWKTTRSVGSVYAGVPEGQRAQVSMPDENDFAAAYRGLGVERNVTVEAEWAGEGFTDNLADEHLRGLQSLWLQEEGIILLGNDGTGATGKNGFQLGTAPAPVGVLATGGSYAASTSLTAFVVLLTGLGNPSNAQYGYQAAPSVANGLVPQFTVNAPGTGASITYNGGMSAVSAASNTVVTTGSTLSATFTVTGYPNGVFGFAWFISTSGSPTTANAKLAAITQFNTYTSLAAPTGTQFANAAGLSTDNSSQAYDFTGLFSWAAKYGYWKDLAGAQLTSLVGGQCAEVETVLEYFFTNFQAGVDAIWGSPDAITSLQRTILANGTQSTSGYNIYLTRDEQNNIIGGLVVSGYQSKYAVDSETGANIIPMKMHPMIPAGTLYFDIAKNPYPESRIPYTRAIMLMKDYYGYEWPAIQRAWAFGTYTDEALGHYTPWLTGVITGIGVTA